MIGHIPKNTRIFIGLSIVTLLLIYLAITLSRVQERSFLGQGPHLRQQTLSFQQKPHTLQDTTNWLEHKDLNYPLVFAYPPSWEIETGDIGSGYYGISLTPPDSDSSIDFYISRKGYLGFDGLRVKTAKAAELARTKPQIINEDLFGLKKGDYYYTFDGSMVTGFDDEFFTILQTVRFE